MSSSDGCLIVDGGGGGGGAGGAGGAAGGGRAVGWQGRVGGATMSSTVSRTVERPIGSCRRE